MPDASPYAYPPRRLREAEAARYVGLSPTAFRALRLPETRIGGTVGWLLDDLDAYLMDQRGSRPEVPDADIRALAARLAAPAPSPRRRKAAP